jgi:ABC-type multidrug transport system fused ATPase/permease subunit
MYRFTILSSVSTFLLTLLALYTGVSPGLTAFLLVAASKCMFSVSEHLYLLVDWILIITVVASTHSLCQQYGQLQMDFVSVERVVEMTHLEQESARPVKPPAWWPSFDGDIVFEDVTIRYGPQFDPALSSVTLRIKAGSNTAIVGRTGRACR